MCVGRDLKQLLDLDEAKCKQSSAAAVPPWLPFSSAPPQAQLLPAQICERGSFPLYPDRKRKSHQTAPGGRTGCVSGPCQLRMGMQSWLLQGRNGIINTSCVICSACVSLMSTGVYHWIEWLLSQLFCCGVCFQEQWLCLEGQGSGSCGFYWAGWETYGKLPA